MEYNEHNKNNNRTKNFNNLRIMATISLVAGIVSLVTCFFPIVSVILAGIGLVLGIIAKVNGENRFSVAGIVTSSFGLAISVVTIVCTILFNTVLADFLKRLNEMFPSNKPNENLPGSNFSIKRVLMDVTSILRK